MKLVYITFLILKLINIIYILENIDLANPKQK